MIAAIMPCRGRPEQTIANVKRLLATAGRVEWKLYCVVSNIHSPKGMPAALEEAGAGLAWLPEFTYWQGLAFVTNRIEQEAPLLCGLANDLLPGRDWLARGLAAYRARFGDGDGLMGFNDGVHGPELSPHFLISRVLLERYGGWPVRYKHAYGDTELCLRAQQDGLYGKAPWACLYHNHPFLGAENDSVYDEGMASLGEDRTLFYQRRGQGWQ